MGARRTRRLTPGTRPALPARLVAMARRRQARRLALRPRSDPATTTIPAARLTLVARSAPGMWSAPATWAVQAARLVAGAWPAGCGFGVRSVVSQARGRRARAGLGHG